MGEHRGTCCESQSLQPPCLAGDLLSWILLEIGQTSWPSMATPSCTGEPAACRSPKLCQAHICVSCCCVGAAPAHMARTLSASNMQLRGTSNFPRLTHPRKFLIIAFEDSDVCHFEVQISGFRGWQPACAIKEDVLAQHFARQADANIRRRRERRVQARKQKWTGMRPRPRRSFLASWHSAGPKQQLLGNSFFLAKNGCVLRPKLRANASKAFLQPLSRSRETQELLKEAHAAARSAGYLLAVSESGLIFDMLEIIGAESLSQGYHFAAQVAHRLPRLQTVVHDDACHLKSMCLKERRTSVMAGKLADLNFIIDDFHSGGHCGEWCKTTCLPSLQQNKDILKGFPTEIAESVNAQFSPLGDCFHHYSPWFAQLVMQECADVRNMTRLQALGDKRRVADKKRKRQALAHSDRQADS